MPHKHAYSSDYDSDDSNDPKRCKSEANSEDYRSKRDRNNVAVRKSREKSRQKAKETMEKVNRLKRENEDLEMKVTLLSKELNLLKDLFLSHAGSGTITEYSIPASSVLVPKTAKSKTLNSNGESDSSGDSMDGSFMDVYGVTVGAGTPANTEAIQKDHEYSAPSGIKVQ